MTILLSDIIRENCGQYFTATTLYRMIETNFLKKINDSAEIIDNIKYYLITIFSFNNIEYMII